MSEQPAKVLVRGSHLNMKAVSRISEAKVETFAAILSSIDTRAN